ncbi:MAG: glyoxalase/bleomycin resistance/dioxygenase family protein [Myxococcota bacterium]
MKRIHLHINVEETKFDASTRFYETLFNAEPTLTRPHYAKWMLEDPAVNFTLEVLEIEGDVPGIHHLGIQVDAEGELEQIRSTLEAAEAPLLEVGRTQCCFADSEKNWTADPQGVRWETFQSFGQLSEYGAKTPKELSLYAENLADES